MLPYILSHTSSFHTVIIQVHTSAYSELIIKHLIEKLDIMSILNEHKQLKHVRFRNIY